MAVRPRKSRPRAGSTPSRVAPDRRRRCRQRLGRTTFAARTPYSVRTATLAPIPGLEGEVYLVTQFGPGTTPANNVAPPVTVFGLRSVFKERVLFSGLTLGPGTYYVVWAPTNHTPHLSMSPQGTELNSTSVTTGIDVSFVGVGLSDTVAPFPPATNTPVAEAAFSLTITVTGDPFALTEEPTAVPTLNAWGMLALAALLVLLTMSSWSRRRKTGV
jgi:hypothetical protein